MFVVDPQQSFLFFMLFVLYILSFPFFLPFFNRRRNDVARRYAKAHVELMGQSDLLVPRPMKAGRYNAAARRVRPRQRRLEPILRLPAGPFSARVFVARRLKCLDGHEKAFWIGTTSGWRC